MKVRWRRIGLVVLAVLLALAGAAVVLWKTGEVDRWTRALVISQVDKATGGKLELGRLHLSLAPFTVEMDGFTLHGREAASEPPFVRIARVVVHLDFRKLLEGKVVLGGVTVERPEVYVRVDRQGHSNIPSPPHRKPSKPWHEQLFAITIDKLRLDDGVIRFNNRRIPLSAEGGQFHFAMDYFASAEGKDFYRGDVGWKNMSVAARKWVPFPSSWSAKFTIGREGGSLDQFRWELPDSYIEARADWPRWTEKRADFHYRVRLNLDDIRVLLRKPHTPLGVVESTGNLRYAPGAWKLHGYYTAKRITMGFTWFHAANMSSRGTLLANSQGLEIPDFQAWAMGGEFDGTVHMDTKTLNFVARTEAHHVILAQLLAAVQNQNLPVQTFHWNADVAIRSVTAWHADFRDMTATGKMNWTPLGTTPAGELPATAALDYDYRMSRNDVFSQGTIETPNTKIVLKGTIGDRDSNMVTDVMANRLRDWDELINTLRGRDMTPVPVLGRAEWKGSITGRISHPLFSGHVHAWNATYDRLHWDEIEGNVDYSPDELTLTDMRVRRGRSLVSLSLYMGFTNWNFGPHSEWTLRARLDHADTADVQALAGTDYPEHGWLSGEFRGRGTRSQPELSGSFQLSDFRAGGFLFPKVTGRLEIDPATVRLAGVRALFGSGSLGGEFSYQQKRGQVAFDLYGESLPLDAISQIQSPSLPLAGRLDFRLIGSGPPRAPKGQGTIQLSSLRAGNELVGDLLGRLSSDGRKLRIQLTTALVRGKMSGMVDLALADNYPIEGKLTAEGVDLDPFIEAGLHLHALTSHSQVSGQFQLSGELLRPETIAVAADVSRVAMSFEHVTLENVGPIRLIYRKADVRVERAELKGPDSNFQLSGVVRFNRDEPLELRVVGAMNLKLLGGFFPQLQSQGAAKVDALVVGTFGQPQINGRAQLENAGLSYSDMPISLSGVNGDLIFSSNHVSFSNLSAEAGGGKMLLSGTVNFPRGASLLQYEIAIDATGVRVRWPTGMSWLFSAKARMIGNTRQATLGGQITLDRLLLTNGLSDAAAFLAAPNQPTIESEESSPFLRNLQLDFTVSSGAGSRLEWTGANIETDANVRVRGTWSRPSVLGHVHLLSGEVNFQGNTFQLSRGDMNFANPLRLDPVLNVEATTTIQQYEITVDLTGRASALRFSYHSDPPLPPSDVISLLALGYTGEASELRSSTSGQYGATALLSAAVSSEVGGRISRLFGISRFSVEPYQGVLGTEPNAGARITIEQQVTRNLTVTYSTNAASNAEEVIQIEYAISRNISVVALRDINGTFGLSIEFKKHFK